MMEEELELSSSQSSIKEILVAAVALEEMMEEFYMRLGDVSSKHGTLFQRFSLEERRRAELLLELVGKVGKAKLTLNRSSMEHVKDIMDSSKRVVEELSKALGSLRYGEEVRLETLLLVMLHAEESAVEFYQALYRAIKPECRELLEGILEEEFRHLENARRVYRALHGVYAQTAGSASNAN